MKTLSIKIPFSGFYESIWSHEIDREQEQYAEYLCSPDHIDSELNHPEELRLDESELNDLFYRHSSYGIAYQIMAREYIDQFSYTIGNGLLGESLNLQFEEITSPKYYNFETDRLFASIPVKTMAKLFAISEQDNHETLAKTIRDRHTSCDGFISYYPNNPETWLQKPLPRWDHNELETLLLACMAIKGLSRDYEFSIYEYGMYEAAYHAFSESVDWSAFEKAREELRDEKRIELGYNPEDLPDYHYFCRDPAQLSLPL